MRRRHTPVRASLALAVLVTALTLLLGSVLLPRTAAEPGVEQAAELTGATATGNTVASAGDQTLPTAGTATSGSDDGTGLPSYAVQDSGPAVEKLPPFKLKRSTKVLRKLPPGPVPGDPFTFGIGTLNILGSQHAANGVGRASALAGAILGRGVDLVGMQEVQDDQLAAMDSRLSGYTVWPGQALGSQGVRLQIAFRDSMFELVDTGSINTVFDFQTRPVPWVLLRDRATQGEFYVVDVHNSPGDQERDRDIATSAEIALINDLRSSGRPVLLMGDTNEHTEFACRVAAATGMVGSNGLSAAGGGCSVGAGPIKIDWILGAGGVDFSGHVVDYAAPISASTDHAFVHATVTVTPSVPPTDSTAGDGSSSETAGD